MRAVALLLLFAGAFAAPAPSSTEVKQFATTHTGSAAGVVSSARGGAQGKETKLGGLDAYVVTPNKPYSAAVLLVPDIFGWKTENIRRWAAKLADAGYLVVVPDYFKGKDRKPSDAASTFADWLKLFPRDKVSQENSAILADIRKQYPSVKKIGVQGFCWGGLHAVLLTQGKNPAVSAAVVYHGSLLTPADVEAVNAPISFQQSDPALDQQINTELYKQIQSILDKKKAGGLDTSIVSYPKQAHGFSLRGNSNDTAVAQASNAAFDAGVAFLNKHLK